LSNAKAGIGRAGLTGGDGADDCFCEHFCNAVFGSHFDGSDFCLESAACENKLDSAQFFGVGALATVLSFTLPMLDGGRGSVGPLLLTSSIDKLGIGKR
jgi:hypothetical protein